MCIGDGAVEEKFGLQEIGCGRTRVKRVGEPVSSHRNSDAVWFGLQGAIIKHKRGVGDVPAKRDVNLPNKVKSVSIVYPGVIALC